MRLLVATDVTVRGGVDGHVLVLADAFRSAGHQVVVLLEQTTTSALRDQAADRGLEVRLAKLYHGAHGMAQLHRAARTVLDELRPDGVHVVCGSPRSCLTLREVAADRDLRVVVTEQQVDSALAVTPELRERVRATYLAARAVVFVSEGNRETMARVVGLDGVSHHVIPNGVHTAGLPRLRPRLTRMDTRGARLVTAARLAPEKMLHLLVEAVSILPPTLVHRVDLFGEGPERDNLLRLIREHHLGARIFVHSWHPRMVEQLTYYDLFVLPSRAEGMSFALLEAMAVGLPVIASNIAGNAEALLHGKAGTLVAQGDSAALADGIRQALARPAWTVRRARIGAAHVRAHHELSALMLRTIDLWATTPTGAAQWTY
jgi:glycosyltransferase involved in cell wall biosynthesis